MASPELTFPEPEVEKGAVVFYLTPDVSWRLGEVLQVHRDQGLCDVDPYPDVLEELPPGEPARVPIEHTHVVDDPDVDALHDMRDMPDPHESVVLHALRRRFHASVMFTYFGPSVMLVFTPSEGGGEPYRREHMQPYLDSAEEDGMPHVWQLARAAYVDMRTSGVSQTVFACGDAGSGKSTVLREVRHFLCRFSALHAPPAAEGLEGRFDAAARVLDTFASVAVGGWSSSCWLQVLRLQFSTAGGLLGAAWDGLLLQPSRVTQRPAQEPIFSSFYQLLASEDGRRVFALGGDPGDYHCGACQPQCAEHSAAAFRATTEAMGALGLKDAERWSVWAIVAGVLHLMLVDFDPREDGSGVQLRDESRERLKFAAVAWGVDKNALEQGLVDAAGAMHLMRLQRAGGDAAAAGAAVQHLVGDARRVRDGLCEHLYCGLFAWLLRRCNDLLLDPSGQPHSAVHLVDACGHGSCPAAQLDALYTNTAGELVQSCYNRHIFRAAQAELEAEGIPAPETSFYDNDDTVALLADPETGLLRLLADQAAADPLDDAGLLRRVTQAFSGHRSFQGEERGFRVRHCNEEVSYDGGGWLLAAGGRLAPWAREALCEGALRKSRDAVVRAAGCTPQQGAAQHPADVVCPPAALFCTELAKLFVAFNATRTRWLRCVAPGPRGGGFNPVSVAAQLHSGNLLETIPAAQHGFSASVPAADFAARFRCLLPRADPAAAPESPRAVCAAVVAAAGCDPGEAPVGRSKVFVRHGALLAHLEDLRAQGLVRHAVTVQAYARWKQAETERELRALQSQEETIASLRDTLVMRSAVACAHDSCREVIRQRELASRDHLERGILVARREMEEAMWGEYRRREAEREERERLRQAENERLRKEERERSEMLLAAQRRQLSALRRAMQPPERPRGPSPHEREAAAQMAAGAPAQQRVKAELAEAAADRAAAEQKFREQRLLQAELRRTKAEEREVRLADAARRAAQHKRQHEARAVLSLERSEARRQRAVLRAQRNTAKRSTSADYRIAGAKQRRDHNERELETRRGGTRELVHWEHGERDSWRDMEELLRRRAQAHVRRIATELRVAVDQEDQREQQRLHAAKADAARRALLQQEAVADACEQERRLLAEQRRRDQESRRLLESARGDLIRAERRKCEVQALGETAARDRRVEELQRACQRAALVRHERVSARRATRQAHGSPGAQSGSPSAGRRISDEQYARLLGPALTRDGLGAAAAVHTDPLTPAAPISPTTPRALHWK
eukprot:TRINITY_DN26567_c0_g1_i1.p1 TRINITY_DN26567_c0_g1~~TRINITY_DN26567_c0_g1_i1.p1  ORF type:complete len:1283 (+),score=414.53 TRINITY_DN26567_c0_g1_i1:79-3849(+)